MRRIKLCLILFLIGLSNAVSAQAPFITTWKTDNPGSSCNSCITIPTHPGSTYNYEVDWDNDGNYEQTGVTGDVTHDFGTPGTYTIALRGDFPRIYFEFSGDRDKIIDVLQWGDIVYNSFRRAFRLCENLLCTASDNPNLSNVMDMSDAFIGCELFDGNVNNWDVSNVQLMNGLFSGASSFNRPMNNWDVSSVTNMDGMFSGATSFNQDISSWDVSSVQSMEFIFSQAIAFDRSINDWNVGNVQNMEGVFDLAVSFNKPLNNWNVSNVNTMLGMFGGATAFNQDIGGWDVSSVTQMGVMFSSAAAFNQDLSGWNLNAAVTFAGFFGNGIFENSGLSCENYSNTLIGWANNSNTPSNKNLGPLTGMEYGAGAGAAARQDLINMGWTFNGDAQGSCSVGSACPTAYTITYPSNSCEGEPFDFQVNLVGGTGTYDIEVVSQTGSVFGSLNGVTGSSFTIPATFPMTGTYTFDVIVNDGFTNCTAMTRLPASTGEHNVFSGGVGFAGVPSSGCEGQGYDIIVEVFTNPMPNPPYQITVTERQNFVPIETYDITTNALSEVITIPPRSSGMYDFIVSATDANGCGYITQAVITEIEIFPSPQPTIEGETVVCPDQSITLTPQNPGAYQSYFWEPSGNSNAPELIIGDGSGEQFYQLWVTDFNGCTGSDEVLIDNIADPVFIIDIVTQTASGGNDNGSAEVRTQDGNLPFTFSWSGSSSGSDQSDDPDYTIADLSVGSYNVTVTDSDGCSSETSFSITASDCSHPDVPTLLALYASTDSTNWINKSGWSEGALGNNCDPCGIEPGNSEWDGISCENNRVTLLLLGSNQLTGELPFLAGLDSLSFINLSDNNLTGEWNFANPNLIGINMSMNPNLKTTLPNFNLPNLVEIIAYGDSLQGPLPDLSSVPKLRDLYIYDNEFNTIVPDWQLDSLVGISLYNCGLTGVLPSLSASQKLEEAYFDGNTFEGTIPSYYLFPELRLLNLNTNNLSGCMTIDEYCNNGVNFDFRNNPLLADGGVDNSACGSGFEEEGEACDDGNPDTTDDRIQGPDCECRGDVPGGMRPFVTTWVTNNLGMTGDSSIRVPTFPGETYNYEVDWDYVMGEPFVADTSGITGDFEYNFGREDTVTIAIRGDFPRVHFNNFFTTNGVFNNLESNKIIQVLQWGDIEWSSMQEAFWGCENLTSNALDSPNLSSCQSMRHCFARCSLFNGSIGSWDVSNILDMSFAFSKASVFKGDLSTWNVENVEDMSHLFSGALLFDSDLHWNVSQVNNMSNLFHDAEEFNGNIENWNTSNVNDMSNMFSGALKFNQNINTKVINVPQDEDYLAWDVSSVENMESMFRNAKEFNSTLRSWDVSRVQTFKGMFLGSENFNQEIGSWNTSSVTDISSMFLNATSFNKDIATKVINAGELDEYLAWNVSNVINAFATFSGASNFNHPLGLWNIESVESVSLGDFGIFSNSGLSCENYSATLEGWAANPNTPNDLEMQALGMRYNEQGQAGRAILESKNWTITEDIFDPSCSTQAPCPQLSCRSDEFVFIDIADGDSILLSDVLDTYADGCGFSFDEQQLQTGIEVSCIDACQSPLFTVYDLEQDTSCEVRVFITDLGESCGTVSPIDPLIRISNVEYDGSGTVSVDILCDGFQNVLEYNVNLTYDESVLQYQDASNINSGANLEMVTAVVGSPSYVSLRSNVATPQYVDLADNTRLVTLTFEVIDPNNCQDIQLVAGDVGMGNSTLQNCARAGQPITSQGGIIYFAPPVLDFNITNDSLCAGDDSELFFGNLSDFASATINGQAIIDQMTILSPTETTTYTVAATSNLGCEVDSIFEITVTIPPVLDLTGTEVTACVDSILDLTVLTSASGIWSSTADLDLSNPNAVDLSNNTPGSYSLTFTTNTAVSPCRDLAESIPLTLIDCDDDCCQGEDLQWTVALPADITIFSPDELAAAPPDLSYSNGLSGDCAVEGVVAGVRTMPPSGIECGGVITESWQYQSPCGTPLQASRFVVVVIDAPTWSNTTTIVDQLIECGEEENYEIPLSFDNGVEGQGNISGSVDPIIERSTGSCTDTITLTWTHSSPEECYPDLIWQQQLTFDTQEWTFDFLPEDITIDAQELPYQAENLLVTNEAQGDCLEEVEVTAECVEMIEDNIGFILCTWTFEDECASSPLVYEQTITVDNCLAPVARPEEQTISINARYKINLLANDDLTDSFTLTIVEIENDIFSEQTLGENGEFNYLVEENFIEPIVVHYELCNADLSCGDGEPLCSRSTFTIFDIELQDIVATTVITPNNSNNQTLRFTEADQVENSELWIYNRWGDQVYHTTNYENDWDASGYPGGVYYYVLMVDGVRLKRSLTVVK